MEMDGIESWSVNESMESRLFLLVATTEMLTSPLFFMWVIDEEAFDDPWNVRDAVEKPTRVAIDLNARR